MSKITALFQRALGHLALEFEDGSSALLTRGSHEHLNLKVGDEYPVKESAVDEKPVEQQPAPEVPNASSEQSATASDGDSGAPPVETVQEESRPAENVQEPTPRLRGDEGEQAPAEETKQDGPSAS